MITARAPESSAIWRSSAGGSRNVTGVTTPPARHTAVYAIPTSGQLAIVTITRSPGAMPSSGRPLAIRAAAIEQLAGTVPATLKQQRRVVPAALVGGLA